jgi:multimeric flavodoxin WrbA
MTKVYIIFYTTYGHIYTMAKAVKEGVDSVEGCEGILYQVRIRPHYGATGARLRSGAVEPPF